MDDLQIARATALKDIFGSSDSGSSSYENLGCENNAISLADEITSLNVVQEQDLNISSHPLPAIGMLFDSVDELLTAYQDHAKEKGFAVAIRSSVRDTSSQFKYVSISCDRGRNTYFEKHSKRINCPAKVRAVRQGDNCWSVSKVVVEHNHELIPNLSRFMRGHRKMSMHMKRQLDANDIAGIRPLQGILRRAKLLMVSLHVTVLRFMKEEAADLDLDAAARRIGRLTLHLAPAPAELGGGGGGGGGDGGLALGMESCARGNKGSVRVERSAMSEYMRGKHTEIQERVFDYFNSRSDLQTPLEISKDEHRELCMRQLLGLVREAGIRPFRYVFEDPAKYFAVAEAVGSIDMSLGIKMGVQYSHPSSNVQGLQTTATFDLMRDEFIINTPNEGAIKWWIGNAAVHGKFATVFAKLLLPTHDEKGFADMGVHAFIVPIRDMKTHQTLPGIEIRDCGYKVGLNGVDNGALKFSSVRVPRENLLNRFGDVSRDGKYTSSLPTIGKRFAATLGELVGGRVGLAYSSVGVLKISVTIAVRYSLLRQQFGPPKQPEISILDYQSAT
ncbi:hypothetical protein Syun_013640 [Stephania yunnanensis]|uniref:acyl-CoA oxidase n=1 Tax=Stephania yunnanensis TaxID=152371 RepID=A0AAP0JJV1_9MAGN